MINASLLICFSLFSDAELARQNALLVKLAGHPGSYYAEALHALSDLAADNPDRGDKGKGDRRIASSLVKIARDVAGKIGSHETYFVTCVAAVEVTRRSMIRW